VERDMKRYRHYKRDKAVILSCFGSVVEQNIYLELKREVEERFKGVDIFLSFSSRMVLKDLKRRGIEYKNLPQVLADVDMLGYRNIVVASINLFPTDEHELLIRTVNGFREFSYSNIRHTRAIINKTKETTLLLKELNEKISRDGVANLYVIHGVPLLDLAGLSSVDYTKEFLEMIDSRNFVFSLEGAFPFFAVKETIRRKLKEKNISEVQIVPMLLVSGNHYIKDMVEIRDYFREDFTSSITPSLTKSDRFNLLELERVKEIIFSNIKEEIIKLG
jgi:sirohydrochlorin cobaltochelatase